MSAAPRITVILMAGGPAMRLPGKLTLDVDGRPMLAHLFTQLTSRGWPCVVSVRTPLAPPLAAELAATTMAFDDLADGGPLGGLLCAARAVRTPLFFAAAGDLPNLSPAFVEDLLDAYDAAASHTPAVVMPTWRDGHVEPLAALYDRDAFVRGAEAALSAGKRKVTAALDGLEVLAYPIGSEHEDTLLNVNTPDDLARLRNRAATS